jgi:hypothetical protein
MHLPKQLERSNQCNRRIKVKQEIIELKLEVEIDSEMERKTKPRLARRNHRIKMKKLRVQAGGTEMDVRACTIRRNNSKLSS